MARPRKQTYTLEMYLKKYTKGDVDNNADVQRNFVWNNEQINELVVTVLTDDYIPPIILGEEENSKLHIVDGGCRTVALNKFKNNLHKITSSIENSIIPYKKRVQDGDGNVTYEDDVFDIKNKTYEKLPEELKEKFDEYQIETVIHENCDSYIISRYIKRYNNHVAMNTDQKAFTYIDKFASRIRKILNSKFFVECNSYSERDKVKGVVERIIVDTLMCTNHFDHWKAQAKASCKYINEYATDKEFDNLADNLHRLENIITEDIKDIFNKKDSFIFLTLFDKFTKLENNDLLFAEFLQEFSKNYRNNKRNKKGLLFDEIDKDSGTKDKQVVTDKLSMLEDLMLEFLHINKDEMESAIKNLSVTSKDIIEEFIDKDVNDEDIELYEISANDILEVIDIESDFLSDQNRPSFVALVAYAFKEDTDCELKEWLKNYERDCRLIPNQKENYLHMREDFDLFVKNKMIA